MDIDRIRNGEYERFYEQLLAREGVYSRSVLLPDINVKTWSTALQHFAEQQTLITLEGERLAEPEYWVGHVLEVDSDSLLIRSLDSLGQWDPEPVEFPISDITHVSFDNKYLRVFGDFVRGDVGR